MAEQPRTPEPVTDAESTADPNRISAMKLTRKVGQSIHIGDNVVITITEINVRSNSVKVRVAAPRSTAVHRGEVMQKITRGNLVAATDTTGDEDFILEL